jgi:hypothetical protein
MDELTLLRELDDDAPLLTPRARAAARARLEGEIARQPVRRRSRRSWNRRAAPSVRRPGRSWSDRAAARVERSRRLWSGQAAGWIVLGLAVVGGLVVVVRDMGGDRELTAADLLRSEPAADVLELAARGETPIAPTPIARRDQYVYTREVTEATPLDAGGTPRTFVEEEWRAVDPNGQSRTCEIGRCWTASGSGLLSTEELERIPREPSRLLLYARATFDPSVPEEPFTEADWMEAGPFFMSLLTTPLIVPPDLRAALVESLAYAPGARVVDEQLEFRGRAAAVIHMSWAPGSIIDRYIADIIIDRDTHEYLGQRWELGPSDMKGRNGRLFNSSRVRLVSYLEEAAVVDGMGERP